MNGGRSGNTVRLDLAIISHLFKVAGSEWGFEQLGNPVKAIQKPKVSKGRDRRASPEEVALLLAHFAATGKRRIAAIVTLAVETAMRRSEIVRLLWPNINLDTQVAHLPDTKNGSARDVPLSSLAISTLRGHARPEDLVFNIDPDWITYEFRQACKAVGIVGLRFHDLRHEATSRLFEKGLNIMEVSAVTGHKTLQMLKRYTHLNASVLAKRLG